MKRYLHKFNTNEHRSQYEGGVEYISPYTSLVYEDDSVHYNVFKAQLTLTNGHVITIPQNGNNTDSALTSAETAEYKADIVDVVVGNRVKTLGSGVLSGCTNLENIEFSNSVTTIGSQSFRGCVGLTNVEMPNNVTTIGASAFTSCSKLTEIKIPSGITTINNSAFSGCTKLESVNLPSGLKTIGASAFTNCYSMTSITLPNGITSIGSKAFLYCRNLPNIVIPNTVTSIERECFEYCSKLVEFTIPPLLKTITVELLVGTSIKHLDVPDSVTTMQRYAFSFMRELIDITIGVGISRIEEYTFVDCHKLITLVIKNSSCILATTNAFNGTPIVGSGVGKIYVPYGYGDEFKERANWSTFASHIYELNEDGNIPTE